MKESSISIGVVHFPIYNKRREVVTTSLSTSSLHDIARTAKTFGIGTFYIITPLRLQQHLAERLIQHWQVGYGASYNPTRQVALQDAAIVDNLGECLQGIKDKFGQDPVTIVTTARRQPNSISCAELRQRMRELPRPYIILFGTGWGIEQSMIEAMDIVLEPIFGAYEYNHLSVRAAVAIILDRLINEIR